MIPFPTPVGIYPVGHLPLNVLRTFEKQPRLALITLDDERTAHLSRDIKQNLEKTLTPVEIKGIPNQLKNSRWRKDKIKKNLLVTWVKQGEVWLKMAVEVDTSSRRATAS